MARLPGHGRVNVLLTGGAGFIGSALLERLVAAGHRVAVVDDGSTGDPGRVGRAAAFLKADIAGDGLGGIFAAAAPEAVFHLAAQASVGESVREPCRGAAVNVCGTVNVLGHSLACGVRRFVFASTGGALYGDSAPRPTPEEAPVEPLSPYGASKAAAETYVRTMSRVGGMRYTILRLANVYGPGQGACGEPGVVAAFARAMLDGVRPSIHGDGLAERDYVYVGDAVEAHLLALRTPGDGVFNIGTGTARTVREVFAAVARAVGYAGQPVYGEARPGEARRACLDVGRARRVLGWTAAVPFAKGIAETVRAMPPHAGTRPVRTTPPGGRSTGSRSTT